MHPRALRSAAVAAAIALAVAAGACPARAAAPASARAQVIPAKGVNPCSVLDSDRIGDIVGGDASSSTRAGRHICRWFVRGAVAPAPDADDDADDDDERTVVLVSVERYVGRAKRDIAQNVAEPGAVEVPDLPRAKIAFYDLDVVPPTITVVIGKRLFVVQMNALDDDDATAEALVALAEAVLDEL